MNNKINEKDQLFNSIFLESEYEKCSFFGKLNYTWNWRFFVKHYKNDNLKLNDIPKGRKIDESNYVYNEFLKYWNSELIRSKKNKRQPNLVYPIFHQYGLQLVFLTVFCFIQYFLILNQALYLDDLIKSFNDLNNNSNASKENIIKIGIIMTVFSMIAAYCRSVYNNYTNLISIRTRACLSEFIYRKSLLLSQNGLGETSIGQIVNLLSADMNRLDWFFTMIPYFFVGFSLLGYAIFKLWKYLEYYTFYGVAFLGFVLPVQCLIGVIVSRLREKSAIHTDERVKLVDEFINGIKIIKMYTWELLFCKKIEDARKKEINLIQKSLYFYAISFGLLNSSTKIVVFIILTVFYFSGGLITDQIVFTTLSVFTQVTFLITIFIPHLIMCISNFLVSMKRINKFLSLEEKDQLNSDFCSQFISTVKTSLKENGNNLNKTLNTKKIYDLSVKNLTACYSTIKKGIDNQNFSKDDKSENSCDKNIKLFNVLNNINFDCKPGELIIVVGAVGSGKSSLLQAILSELKIKIGKIDINGKLSYSPQEPWIFSGTIKENILFDSEYDEEKYNEIIKVCALERDLTLFQDGDMTLIGERGVTLSGGQKARINLARSLYFDADIYLLDDPLSAVDAHVAKHIFKQAIDDFLKFKTVVLVTHQLNYVKYADKVLFIKNGEQIFFDQAKTVMKKLIDETDSEFAKFVGSCLENQMTQQYTRKHQDSNRTNLSSSLLSITQSSNALIAKSTLSLGSIDASSLYDEQLDGQLKEINNKEKEKRLEEEDSKVRFVYKSYISYFKYGRILFFGPLILIVFSLNQFLASSSDFVLKLWSDSIKINESTGLSTNITKTLPNEEGLNLIIKFVYDNNVYIYSGLIVTFFFTSSIKTIIFNIYGMTSSINIHEHLFKRIVLAKMIFFYKNSVGVILNRFSRDIQIIDNDLIFVFHDFVEILINGIVIMLVMAISNPFLILPFIIFSICSIWLRNFYIQTGRSLQTLEGVAKSPMIQHLTSTLNGLTTVRAFERENKFIKKFEISQNDHIAVFFASHISRRWFSFMLDFFQVIFIGICFLVLFLFASSFSGSLIGLIVTYILQVIFCWTFLETYLCAVDRIESMGKSLGGGKDSLSEPALESTPECKPPESWPQNARIVFNNVTMRYFKEEEPVLKKLNFTIEEKQKIGIVGRTGAGKSSIVSALFRLTDYEGDIIIDGINCKSIGLHDLRGKISIIPQEPILFTGTIRSNLDPGDQFKDDKLWNSLKAVQLEQVVKELEGGLDSKVTDNGSNFSVGQKQLICLARAILKENKILVLDEATANCDPKTDSLIQTTIRNAFKDCSILTIAHRLNTIMDSTKILVLDAGEVKEFDKPVELLKNEDGLFRSMVYANGEKQADHLISLSKESAF